MAYEILRYASGASHTRPDGVKERERLVQGLNRLAKTFTKDMHATQLRGIQDAQQAAQTDLIQGTIDPKRRENDEAYAAVVTRNEVMTQVEKLKLELENPASVDANTNPKEYVKRLNDEAKAFHESISSDPMARTQKRVFNDLFTRMQPGLVAAQADVYRNNMKSRQVMEATKAMGNLPPADGDTFNLNTASLISQTLPPDRFTTAERLNTVMAGALAAAHKGDRRLLDYAISEMEADSLNPATVQQAENAYSKAKRKKEDTAWAEAMVEREKQAESGTYMTWEKDLSDPETVRRFTAGTINRWKRTSHNSRIQIQNMDDATNDFYAGKPMHYDDKTVQAVFEKEKRNIMREAAQTGNENATLAAIQNYAGLLARQGHIDKSLKLDFKSKFGKPVWTKEAFMDPAFQDAVLVFDEIQAQMSNDQLVDQMGDEATKNAFMVQQFVEEAGGDFEKAAEAYVQFQNGIKERPPIKGEKLEDNELTESVSNIINGEVEGSDPAMDRWWGLTSAADEAIHTRQLEYELNKVYSAEREKGASKETARKIAETFVGKNAKFFANELVWTAGAPINQTIGMPSGSTAEDRQAAWEGFCKKYGLDPKETHYRQSGQYGYITDADGNEVEGLGMFHSVEIGSSYDLAMREEAEEQEARNQEDMINDMTNRNRMFETALNAKTGFNDKAQILSDGTTLDQYKDADEETRVKIRKTYDEEHRTWLGRLGLKATGFVRDVLDGKFKGEAAERFKTVANQDVRAMMDGIKLTPEEIEMAGLLPADSMANVMLEQEKAKVRKNSATTLEEEGNAVEAFKKSLGVPPTEKKEGEVQRILRKPDPEVKNLAPYPNKSHKVRGLRNNNPGNIEHSRNKWQGLAPSADARFATFQTPEHGIRAMGIDLRTKYRRGLDTIAKVIGVWSPVGDATNAKGSTAAYIKDVAKKTGWGPNDKLDLHDMAQLKKLAHAMSLHENGNKTFTDAEWDKGISMIK